MALMPKVNSRTSTGTSGWSNRNAQGVAAVLRDGPHLLGRDPVVDEPVAHGPPHLGRPVAGP